MNPETVHLSGVLLLTGSTIAPDLLKKQFPPGFGLIRASRLRDLIDMNLFQNRFFLSS
jgi:hypothetical protein